MGSEISKSTKQISVAVVMSIWSGDKPHQVKQAIDSIIFQNRQPDEFIIVTDGPVSKIIDECLHSYEIYKFIRILKLITNQGRGAARNHAIRASNSDIIMIMDADDISRKNRINIQLNTMISKRLDLLGGFIEEFTDKIGDSGTIRRVPLNHEKILHLVRFRSAFNHVTIMFKKKLFDKINGYSNLNYVEDWDFYLRAIDAGARVGNISETLVDVRTAVWRRQSTKYFAEEVIVSYRALKRRQISLLAFSITLFLRIGKYIIPTFILNKLYIKFLREKI